MPDRDGYLRRRSRAVIGHVARIVVAALLALTVAAAVALAAQDGGQEQAAPTSSTAEPAPSGVEVESARTAVSDTYKLPDGSRETRIYQTPINYRDDDGNWKPIDVDLHQTPGGAIENGSSSFNLTLPARLGAGASRIEIGDQWVSTRLLGDATDAAEVEGATATYEGSGQTSFEMTSTASGLKERIDISDATSPSAFHYELSASADLEPKLEEDGSIVFREKGGGAVVVLPTPTVSRAAPGAAPSGAPIEYQLEALSDGRWRLSVVVDRTWLEAAGRDFPVQIDPSLEATGSASTNCEYFVKEPSGKTNSPLTCLLGPPTEINAEYEKSGETTTRSRSAVSFDLTAIPTTGSVESATVHLFDPESAPKGLEEVQLRRATQSWNRALDWFRYNGLNWWDNAGGDFTSEGSGLSVAERGSGEGWWSFTKGLAPLVNGWVHGTVPNQGLIVKLANESTCGCGANRFRFIASGSGSLEKRPYLSVVYLTKAPSDSKITSPTDGTKTAKRFKLATAWTHSGVTGVKFQYETKEGWADVPASKVKKASGASVSWPLEVKSGAKASEPLYWDASELATSSPRVKARVRAVLYGTSGSDGWVEPVGVEVNRDLGGPKDAVTGIGPGSVDLLTGNFTVAATDVSIPVFNSALEFGRSFSSRDAKVEEKGVLGPGWAPSAPVEEAGGSAWRSVMEVKETETYEGESFTYEYARVTGMEGEEIPFERDEETGLYLTPPEMTGYSLTRESGPKFRLSDPEGNVTIFEKKGGEEFVPVSVTMAGGPGNSTKMFYKVLEGGNRRLEQVIAPTPAGLECPEGSATTTTGCHALTFTYKSATTWGGEASMGERLALITYYAPGNGGPWTVAEYEYDNKGRLVTEWDPRISPALKETYAYGSAGQIETITPPGQKPWTMQYGTAEGETTGDGRLISVKRDSLLGSEAQTTIAYGVPLSTGEGGPYEMSPSRVAEWGQEDVPMDATAVFPPDQVPSSPPSSYLRATVYYVDAEGFNVNTATPSGAGTEAPSISTTETDQYGNVTREVTPANRLRALAEASEAARKARAEQLETRRVYGAEGTQLEEEEGPLHQVRVVELGETKAARAYTSFKYDQLPEGVTLPSPDPHLPTESTSGAKVGGELKDQRTTRTEYDWTLRKPTATIVDPGSGHLQIKSFVAYDKESGLPTETRQPKSSGESASPGATKTRYYTKGGGGSGGASNCAATEYMGLPCKVEPGAQTSGTGPPELLVKWFKSYNALGEPTEVIESPGGKEAEVRKTITEYDTAGRVLSSKVEGGGTAVAATVTEYSPTLGLPTVQHFACESSCEPTAAEYLSSFGSEGSGNGQFSHPSDVAIAPSGNLLVADWNNNRLQEFNSKGEFLKSIGSKGSGNGQFNHPAAIAFTPAGNFVVADRNNNRLQEFNSKGEFLKSIGSKGSGNGQFRAPEGVAVDAAGNIWVSDTENERIQLLNEAGEFIKVVNPAGVGWIEPAGIDVGPSGNIFVADRRLSRVVELTESGGFVRWFGGSGSGDGQLNHPDEVAVDASGTVWIGDEGNGRVQAFGPNGTYIKKFGSSGTGAGQFRFVPPFGIAADAEGHLWVTDPNNNRVQKWSTGKLATSAQATTTTYDELGRPVSY